MARLVLVVLAVDMKRSSVASACNRFFDGNTLLFATLA